VESREWKEAYAKVVRELAPEAAVIEITANELTSILDPGLPLRFSFKRAFQLPTSAGTWKTTFGAQSPQARADLAFLSGKKVGLVSGSRWRFAAERISSALRETALRAGHEVDLSPLYIEFGEQGHDWPLPHLATRIQHDPSARTRLAEAARNALAASWRDVLLFPPLFLEASLADWLEKELAVPVAECLSTTEPVAGHRLNQAIEASLASKNISLHRVSGLQSVVEGERVKSLTARRAGDGELIEIAPRHLVLATGKYLGGGVEATLDEIREPVLGLPLFQPETPFPIRYRGEVQSWTKIGVRADSQFRPVDQNGAPVLGNVSVCGSLLGGADFAREGLGAGYLALTGRRCGGLAP
jgi:glycerol-3-phosphate dehydrogenase subunit B